MKTNEIVNARNEIKSHLGSEVYIKANKGRKRISVKKGIIDRAYPSIFVVKVHDENNQDSFRTMSYSYTDLITNNVKLTLCE